MNLELSFGLTGIMNDGGTLFLMNGRDDSSDNELLQQIRAGDEHAFATLYRRRHAGVYRFALQMSGSQALAEDVTQEVFMVLIRGTDLFDPARGSLSSFLYGVARNQTLRRLHRDRFFVPLSGNDDSELDHTSLSKPLDELARTETIESVRKAVLSLPERYREVVVLCELEEMSYAETAAALGCAIGTVRSRLHRARLLLTDKLRPAESQDEAAVKTARCFA
ncbi:MAG TPA: RNA polymerase sigma factor [Pyrinomonadaceae bacterium]|nr:RNA polymerase sigma factor [Pyrinomonadaceae bacterium]